jgi:hypothetical protein
MNLHRCKNLKGYEIIPMIPHGLSGLVGKGTGLMDENMDTFIFQLRN